LANYFADDASIFDQSQAYRLRGKADILREIGAWFQSSELRAYQMLDPQVQIFGPTALLAYYFTETGVTGGKEFSNAGKISTLFVKQDRVWRAVHEHISVNR
jgi:ketosteroid isomerase-like protein